MSLPKKPRISARDRAILDCVAVVESMMLTGRRAPTNDQRVAAEWLRSAAARMREMLGGARR